MSLVDLFARSLKEKQFLANISPKTVRSYQQAFNAYQRVLSGQVGRTIQADEVPTKDALKDFVISYGVTCASVILSASCNSPLPD